MQRLKCGGAVKRIEKASTARTAFVIDSHSNVTVLARSSLRDGPSTNPMAISTTFQFSQERTGISSMPLLAFYQKGNPRFSDTISPLASHVNIPDTAIYIAGQRQVRNCEGAKKSSARFDRSPRCIVKTLANCLSTYPLTNQDGYPGNTTVSGLRKSDTVQTGGPIADCDREDVLLQELMFSAIVPTLTLFDLALLIILLLGSNP
ncbi:hypothetical protein JOM56_000120 [Amanita muscaria]